MENMEGLISPDFWRDKRVFVTGHTGFKGSWLSIWLHHMGAKVQGFSLAPPTTPNLFELSGLESKIENVTGDIRDLEQLRRSMRNFAPDIVFHLAAQPLVTDSYTDPVNTFSTNVMGTVNVLEVARKCKTVKVVLNVTTDKCYENREWVWGYRESDPLGGQDPYSVSKACSELVTSAYRDSFSDSGGNNVRDSLVIASARAGNVIGGGDWARGRLFPDCVRAISTKQPITLRYPEAVRPWQYVLEPLAGYLLLAQAMYNYGESFAGAWNFGPDIDSEQTVRTVVMKFFQKTGTNIEILVDNDHRFHEAHQLRLDSSKARINLAWHPIWGLEQALERLVDWTMGFMNGENVEGLCLGQVTAYMRDMARNPQCEIRSRIL